MLAGPGLRGESDIVGYPTYANFNIRHYTQLFALAVVVFPVVLAVAYVTLGRVLPRVLDRVGSRVVVEGSGMAARLGVPGVALGLTGAVAAHVSARGVWIALVLGVVGWASLAARTIQFRSLDRGVPRYLVQAASCPQWRGFTGNVLYLRHDSRAAVTLTLQRSTSRLG